MSVKTTMITYQALQQQLVQADTDIGAAEAQGILNGLLCTNNQAALPVWLQLIFENVDLNNAQIESVKIVLQQLYKDTLALYRDSMRNIDVLLPDDEMPLAHRLEMLALWSNGFLYGLGLGQADLKNLSNEANDVIRSFTDFSKIDLENLDEDESSEADYIELVEFLKIGTTLVKEDLLTHEEN